MDAKMLDKLIDKLTDEQAEAILDDLVKTLYKEVTGAVDAKFGDKVAKALEDWDDMKDDVKTIGHLFWHCSDKEIEEAGLSLERINDAIEYGCLQKVTKGQPPCMVPNLYDDTQVAFAYIDAEDELHIVYGSVDLVRNEDEDVNYKEHDKATLHPWFTKDKTKVLRRIKKFCKKYDFELPFAPRMSIHCDYLSVLIDPYAGGLDCRIHRDIQFEAD